MRANRKLWVLAAIAVLVLAGIATAAGTKRFATGKDQGKNPVASAQGVTKEPHAVYAKITSQPRGLRFGAKYTTFCRKETNGGTRGHTFTGTTPARKKLRLRFSDPDACNVSAIAGMEGTGTVKVTLLAKHQ
jgi:hypothetical protein